MRAPRGLLQRNPACRRWQPILPVDDGWLVARFSSLLGVWGRANQTNPKQHGMSKEHQPRSTAPPDSQVRQVGKVLKRLSPREISRGLRRHPMVFEGREAVKLFQETGVAKNPTDALAIGNAFLREDEITKQPHHDGIIICVLCPTRAASILSCVQRVFVSVLWPFSFLFVRVSFVSRPRASVLVCVPLSLSGSLGSSRRVFSLLPVLYGFCFFCSVLWSGAAVGRREDQTQSDKITLTFFL